MRTTEFTAADVTDATDLTRATALLVCDGLVDAGWLEEVTEHRQPTGTGRGRPPRTYRLRDDAGVVLGIDAGNHRYTGLLANLRGETLAEVSREFDPKDMSAEDRRRLAVSLTDDLLRATSNRGEDVLTIVIGVPIPVGPDGLPSAGIPYARTRNVPDFRGSFGGELIVENDANLASLAERATRPGQDNLIALLSGERFGAGLIINGRLLRGADGSAGEMRFLELVESVGSWEGLGALARRSAREAIATNRHPTSVLAAIPTEQIQAEQVFQAAAAGDALASDIIDQLGDRLARIAAVLTSLLGVRHIIVAGAVAVAAEPVLQRARELLRSDFEPPIPELTASMLGGRVVALGGVQLALDRIRSNTLEYEPRRAAAR